ncbi:MAG: hypothetical protein AAFY88_13465, partial [Acidobacteriota bacterium]
VGDVFFDPQSGSYRDPPGGWNHESNLTISSTELAIAAALYHSRWDSPVFANLNVGPAGAESIRAVLLRAATFFADSPGEMPHQLCGQGQFDPLPSGVPYEFQVAASCLGSSGSFALEELTFDTWENGSYQPDQTVLADAAGQPWWPWYTQYVGDPPIGDDGFTAEHLLEASRRLVDRAVVRGWIETQRFRGDDVVEENRFAADIAARHLEARDR